MLITEQNPPLEVQTEVFSGPIALLLHLIEREGFDITAVSLVEVTDKYFAALHSADTIDMKALADFVAIGARLLFLKSKALLPRSAEAAAEDEREAEEVARDLAAQLEEYRNFKEAAGYLRQLEEAGHRSFARVAPLAFDFRPTGLEKVTMKKLIRALEKALERLPPEPSPERLQRMMLNVGERREALLNAVRAIGLLPFARLLAECHNRLEAIVSFMALLDLIKTEDIEAEQSQAFGDIVLRIPGDPIPGAATA